MSQNIYAFAAQAVFAGEIDEVLMVVLAEQADGDGERVELQRSVSFDEQDLALGMDTYCVCLASGATAYGGVGSWSLNGRGLRLRLEGEPARVLGLDEITIDVGAAHWAALEKMLPTVLVGVPRL